MGTKAQAVRALIAKHKSKGKDAVVELVVKAKLLPSVALCRVYVHNNWDKSSKPKPTAKKTQAVTASKKGAK